MIAPQGRAQDRVERDVVVRVGLRSPSASEPVGSRPSGNTQLTMRIAFPAPAPLGGSSPQTYNFTGTPPWFAKLRQAFDESGDEPVDRG